MLESFRKNNCFFLEKKNFIVALFKRSQFPKKKDNDYNNFKWKESKVQNNPFSQYKHTKEKEK